MGGNDKGEAVKDLYLKGEYSNGEEVKFDDRIQGAFHGSTVRERGGELDWKLKVFSSGTVWLMNASEAIRISDHDGVYKCKEKNVALEGARAREDFEEPIASITFKFKDDCDPAKGKETCDIKIALKNWKNLI